MLACWPCWSSAFLVTGSFVHEISQTENTGSDFWVARNGGHGVGAHVVTGLAGDLHLGHGSSCGCLSRK